MDRILKRECSDSLSAEREVSFRKKTINVKTKQRLMVKVSGMTDLTD